MLPVKSAEQYLFKYIHRQSSKATLTLTWIYRIKLFLLCVSMENIALSDSNDDINDRVVDTDNQFRFNSRALNEQQQHVATELQDAANTDVTKGMFVVSVVQSLFNPSF